RRIAFKISHSHPTRSGEIVPGSRRRRAPSDLRKLRDRQAQPRSLEEVVCVCTGRRVLNLHAGRLALEHQVRNREVPVFADFERLRGRRNQNWIDLEFRAVGMKNQPVLDQMGSEFRPHAVRRLTYGDYLGATSIQKYNVGPLTEFCRVRHTCPSTGIRREPATVWSMYHVRSLPIPI